MADDKQKQIEKVAKAAIELYGETQKIKLDPYAVTQKLAKGEITSNDIGWGTAFKNGEVNDALQVDAHIKSAVSMNDIIPVLNAIERVSQDNAWAAQKVNSMMDLPVETMSVGEMQATPVDVSDLTHSQANILAQFEVQHQNQATFIQDVLAAAMVTDVSAQHIIENIEEYQNHFDYPITEEHIQLALQEFGDFHDSQATMDIEVPKFVRPQDTLNNVVIPSIGELQQETLDSIHTPMPVEDNPLENTLDIDTQGIYPDAPKAVSESALQAIAVGEFDTSQTFDSLDTDFVGEDTVVEMLPATNNTNLSSGSYVFQQSSVTNVPTGLSSDAQMITDKIIQRRLEDTLMGLRKELGQLGLNEQQIDASLQNASSMDLLAVSKGELSAVSSQPEILSVDSASVSSLNGTQKIDITFLQQKDKAAIDEKLQSDVGVYELIKASIAMKGQEHGKAHLKTVITELFGQGYFEKNQLHSMYDFYLNKLNGDSGWTQTAQPPSENSNNFEQDGPWDDGAF